MKKQYDYFIIIFLLLISLLFFYPVFMGKHPIPTDSLVGLYHPWRDVYSQSYPRGVPFKNFLITDPIRQQIPWRKNVISQWRDNQFPIWNSYNFLGTPLFANSQAAPFYFMNLLFFIMDFSKSWILLILLQPFLASLFMYLYLRNLNLQKAACVFGSLVWSFSGFHIAWLTWGTIDHVSIWIPLALFCVDKILGSDNQKYRKFFWFCVLSLSLISSFFAGHIQIFFYLILIFVFYLLWQTYIQKRARTNLIYILICLLFLVAVTSIQWVPNFQFYQISNRLYETQNWQSEGWFFPLQHFIQFLIPDFYGNPTTLNYWGVWNYGEFIGYIGVVPLIYALFALFFIRNIKFLFYKILIIVGIIYMVSSPLSQLIYILRIPILSSFQPTRFLVIIDFALSILSAVGFSFWIDKSNEKIKKTVCLVFAAFVVIVFIQNFTIYFSTDVTNISNYLISRRNTIFQLMLFISFVVILSIRRIRVPVGITAGIIILLTIVDLFRFGWKFSPFSPKEYFFPESGILSYLQNAEKPFRVMGTDDRLAPPNTLAFYGIESVGGYDPIYLSNYEKFLAASERNEPNILPPYGFNRIISPKNIHTPLLKYLDVKYILSFDYIDDPGFKFILEEGQTKLYENLGFHKRVYFACNIQTYDSEEDLINKMFKSDQKDNSTVYINQPYTKGEILSDCQQNKADIMEYKNNLMIVYTDSKSEGYLVVLNSYSPHLEVYIDETQSNFDNVNFLFIGINIPRGKHEIRLRYTI